MHFLCKRKRHASTTAPDGIAAYDGNAAILPAEIVYLARQIYGCIWLSKWLFYLHDAKAIAIKGRWPSQDVSEDVVHHSNLSLAPFMTCVVSACEFFCSYVRIRSFLPPRLCSQRRGDHPWQRAFTLGLPQQSRKIARRSAVSSRLAEPAGRLVRRQPIQPQTHRAGDTSSLST